MKSDTNSTFGGRSIALLVIAFIASASIWPLSQVHGMFPFSVSTLLIISIIVAACSQMMLIFRYEAAASLPRFYTNLALWMFIGTCIFFLIASHIFAGASRTDPSAVEAWGFFLARFLLVIVLLIASMNLHHVDEDQGIGNRAYAGWVVIAGIVLVCALFLVGFFVSLPSVFPVGVLQQPQEIVLFALFITNFVITIRAGTWQKRHFAFGMTWFHLLQSIASLYYIFAGGIGSGFGIAGSLLQVAALASPLVAMQVKMFGLYRSAEIYRIKKKQPRFGPTSGIQQKLDADIFRQSVEQAQDPLYIANDTGDVIFVNQGFLNMTGFTHRDVRGKSPDVWSHKVEGQQSYSEIFSQMKVRKEPYSGTRWHRRKDGTPYESTVFISPVVDEFGEVAWFITREHDLTEGRERTFFLQQILDYMPIGICLIEAPTTKIVLKSQYADTLLRKAGCQSVQLLSDIAEKFSLATGKAYPAEELPYAETMRTKEESKEDDLHIASLKKESGSNGIMIWKMQATPLFDAQGELKHVLVALDDITRQKQMEHKMTDAISVASHQLRTPLTGIKWAVDELRRDEKFGASKEDKIEIFNTLYDATVRMFNVVQGLLDVSKLEQETVEIRPETFSLKALIGDVVRELQPHIQKKNLKVKQSELGSIPEAEFDVLLVRQVIQNLMDNAIKYTPEGGEIDSVLRIDNGRIEWALHDTGIGIPKEDLEHLFDKFHRGDNAQSVDAYGMGLGLYTVKSIMDMMNGEVRCESELDKGTTFRVFFPLQKEV